MSSRRILWQSHIGFPCLYRSGPDVNFSYFPYHIKKISWKTSAHVTGWRSGVLGGSCHCRTSWRTSVCIASALLLENSYAFSSLFAFGCALALSLISLPLERTLCIFTFLVITRSLMERGQEGSRYSLTGGFEIIPLTSAIMTPTHFSHFK